MLTTRRILMSCANKSNLDNFWKGLTNSNMPVTGIASDGTYNFLKHLSPDLVSNINTVDLITGYPSLLGGKVKTLHPNIFAGILANPESACDSTELNNFDLNPIDIVCVNLYNVEQELQKYYDNREKVAIDHWTHNVDKHPILKNIDIGGSALLRAACKNYKNVLPIVDPDDYEYILNAIDKSKYTGLSSSFYFSADERKKFAAKAFDHITCHDMMISQYLNNDEIKYRKYVQVSPLKYGCNPSQQASMLKVSKDGCQSVDQPMPFEILNGDVSYINVLDAILSWNCVNTIKKYTNSTTVSASFKHNSPAGIAFGNVSNDFKKNNSLYLARNCDPLSSFGDFVAHSGIVDVKMALYLKTQVSDGIIADDFTDDAIEILSQKKNGKYIILRSNIDTLNKYTETYDTNTGEYRELYGIALYQEHYKSTHIQKLLECLYNNVKSKYLNDAYIGTLSLNFIPSNSVTFTYDGKVVGIGCGQQNRVDCIRLAGSKARQWARVNDIDLSDPKNSKMFVMSSDGFLPFVDNIEVAKDYNVGLIIQPGGSIQDEQIQDACDKYNINMVKTGQRLFTH